MAAGSILKVVVFGALNAGKTTFVEKLSGLSLFLKGDVDSITLEELGEKIAAEAVKLAKHAGRNK